jgi:chromosome segregation ATPase
MSWAKSTVAELLSTAELEVARLEQRAHVDAAARVRSGRRAIGSVAARVRARLVEHTAQAEMAAESLHTAAQDARRAADEDAARIRTGAEDEAARIRREAESYYDQVEARAQRRLEQAESGAKVLRDQTAEEVMRTQREAKDEARRLREDAAAFLTTAREEADALREQARHRLQDARDEVAALARRRDAIEEELRQLSGVIEALAVPSTAEPRMSDRPGVPATGAHPHESVRREEGQ